MSICDLFTTAARGKDSEDNKKEPGDSKEQVHKTALGRRASGVTTKLSKPGEQVYNCELAYNGNGRLVITHFP